MDKKIKTKIRFLPLLIIVLQLFYSIQTILTTDIVFVTKHYLGFIFVALCLISLVLKSNLALYLTGVTLFLGASNIIAFTPVIEAYTFGLKVNGKSLVNIKLQIFSTIVLIFYLLLNGRLLILEIRQGLDGKPSV